MTPKYFLRYGGLFLIILGMAGAFGTLGKLSDAAFFHPPYWINFVHMGLGLFILCVSFTSYLKLQSFLALSAGVTGTILGLFGLLFGKIIATKYNIPELADPTEHTAHLTVGILALLSWKNRQTSQLTSKGN